MVWRTAGKTGKTIIGGRDSPHEVFDPWVRWDLGLDRIRSFRVVVVVVVVVVLTALPLFIINAP